MSFTRPEPKLRSLVRVEGGIRWRTGWVGEVVGDVNARVGVRCDSRVAMRVAGVVVAIFLVIQRFGSAREIIFECELVDEVKSGLDELRSEAGPPSVRGNCGLACHDRYHHERENGLKDLVFFLYCMRVFDVHGRHYMYVHMEATMLIT